MKALRKRNNIPETLMGGSFPPHLFSCVVWLTRACELIGCASFECSVVACLGCDYASDVVAWIGYVYLFFVSFKML